MREIKFRAWDTDNNLFVICEDHQIRQINNDYAGLGNRYVYQQYTGQKDIAENEVYDGDVIKNCDTDLLQVVYWHEGASAWYCRYVEDEKRIVSLADSLGNLNFVIGNIYETPELLTHDR